MKNPPNHPKIRRLVALVTTGLALAVAAPAQEDDPSKITLKTETLGPNLYMLSGVGGFAGGNVGVLAGEDGVLLVDAMNGPMEAKLRAAVAAINPRPVRFVLNTHEHGDHTGGNLTLGHTAILVAHDNVRRSLAEDESFAGKAGTRAPKHFLPVVTYAGTINLHLNGEEVRGVHFPAAHTDGDTVVYFVNSNVVQMGDTFFNGMYPFIGRGGSIPGLLALLDKVLAALPADAKVIPGHGDLASKADFAAFVAMMHETTAIVGRGVEQGKTAEQLQGERALAAYDERWGKGYLTTDAFIAQLHRVWSAG